MNWVFKKSFSLCLISLLSVCCTVNAGSNYAKGIDSKAVNSGVGFVGTHKEKYFSVVRHVDALMETYVNYYSVDKTERRIVIKQQLTPDEKKEIAKAARDLDDVVYTFSHCSPGDYDYLEVRDKYLPLVKEMSHRFHTFIMQPLGISNLEVYDHLRRVMVPTIAVGTALGVLLLLKKLDYLPSWMTMDDSTLYTVAVVVAAAGILYNYKDELCSYGQQIDLIKALQSDQGAVTPGTDFAALVQNVEKIQENAEGNDSLKALAQDVIEVAKNVVVQPAAPAVESDVSA